MPIIFFKIVFIIFIIIALFGFFFTEKLLDFFYRSNSWYYRRCGIDAQFKTISPKFTKFSSLLGAVILIFIFAIGMDVLEKKSQNISTEPKAEVTETINLEDPDMKTVYDF